jgi:hypothetical protein
MFNTSQDILYLIIGVSVGLVAIFSCLIMFYVAMIIRNFHKIGKDIKAKIEKFETALERSATHLGLIVDIAKEAVKHMIEKKRHKK